MAQQCIQRIAAQHGVHFTSKSNPDGKGYKAYAYRPGELPMCTCMPFLRGRKKEAERLGVANNEVAFSCSHLKTLFAEGCDWHETDQTGHQYDNICPQCGSPVVDDGEIADITDEAAVASLLSLARELSGDDVVVPLELTPAPDGGKYRDIAADLIAAARG